MALPLPAAPAADAACCVAGTAAAAPASSAAAPPLVLLCAPAPALSLKLSIVLGCAAAWLPACAPTAASVAASPCRRLRPALPVLQSNLSPVSDHTAHRTLCRHFDLHW